jgi:hypothetical protein
MTQLIVERMAALDGLATVDEIVDAIADGAGVPWNYIFQRYQQYLCQAHQRSGVTINESMVTPDPQLGWVAPDFDPSNPTHRRNALRYVVNRRLQLHSEPGVYHRRAWAVRVGDGKHPRYQLNPDQSQMPRIVEMNGRTATFDATTRAEIGAGKAAQVAVIVRNSDRRTFDLLNPTQQATLLRWLTYRLESSDHRNRSSGTVRTVLADWKRRDFDHQAALDKLRDLLCRDAD